MPNASHTSAMPVLSVSAARWHELLSSMPGRLGVFAVTGLLYYVSGYFALKILSEPGGVAVFWPASGIAAGLIATLSKPARLPILLAVVSATVVANLQARTSIAAILVFALCNAAECAVFGWVLERLDKNKARLETLPSFAAFLAAAIIGAGLAAAPAALAISFLGMSTSSIPEVWFAWFKSDALGIIVVAPTLITLPALRRHRPGLGTMIEGCFGVGVAVAAAVAAFGLPLSTSAWSIVAPTTLLFPVFLWLAKRTPAAFSALGIVAVSIVVVTFVLADIGRIGDPSLPLGERLTASQVLILTTSLAVMTLTAMFASIKNVALALQASEQHLSRALAAGRMYAYDFDVDHNVVQRTGGLLDRIGLPRFGNLDDYKRALHPADIASLEAAIANLSPAEPAWVRKIRFKLSEGDILTVEQRSEAEFDIHGRLVRIRGTCVDITQRERAQQALEESEAVLRSALDAGRVFAFDYDAATHNVRRSDNAAAILGVSLETARTARNLFVEHIHPDDRSALDSFRRNLTSMSSHNNEAFRFVRPAGGDAWLELTATSTHDPNGKLLRLRGLCRDVTARKRAEQRQADLIGELNHRVKNALASVASILRLSRKDHPSIDSYAAAIEQRIRSMAHAHERLSRSNWTGVDLATLIADELDPFRTPDNCTELGPDIVLPPNLVQSISITLHELATNASKYGALQPFNGRVDVMWKVVTDRKLGPCVHVSWCEHCLTPVAAPTRESFGLRTIRRQLAHEHKARVILRFEPNGVQCEIDLPIALAPDSTDVDERAEPAIKSEPAIVPQAQP